MNTYEVIQGGEKVITIKADKVSSENDRYTFFTLDKDGQNQEEVAAFSKSFVIGWRKVEEKQAVSS